MVFRSSPEMNSSASSKISFQNISFKADLLNLTKIAKVSKIRNNLFLEFVQSRFSELKHNYYIDAVSFFRLVELSYSRSILLVCRCCKSALFLSFFTGMLTQFFYSILVHKFGLMLLTEYSLFHFQSLRYNFFLFLPL
jgi:hypothetical protein